MPGHVEPSGREYSHPERPATDGWSGLAAAATIGPFFVVEQLVDGPVDRLGDGASWLPLSEFADHPDGLISRVAAVGASPLLRTIGTPSVAARAHHPVSSRMAAPRLPSSHMAAPRPTAARRTTQEAMCVRIAASIAFLGVAARLVSPGIGSVLSTGIAPALSWDNLHWQPVPTGILPLACGPVSGWRARSDSTSQLDSTTIAILRDTVVTPTQALGETVAARYGLSSKVVHGNLASAITVAALTAARSGRCSERAAVYVADALLRECGLETSGAFSAPAGGPAQFRRNSCCLLYRAGNGRCEDCVLVFGGR